MFRSNHKLFICILFLSNSSCNSAGSGGGTSDKAKTEKTSSKDASSGNPESKDLGFDGVKTSYQGIWDKTRCTDGANEDQDCRAFSKINNVWWRIEFFDSGSKAALYTKTVASPDVSVFYQVDTLSSPQKLTYYNSYDLSLNNGELTYCFVKTNCIHFQQTSQTNDPNTIKALTAFNSFGSIATDTGNSIGYCMTPTSKACKQLPRVPHNNIASLIDSFNPRSTSKVTLAPGFTIQDWALCDNFSFSPQKKFVPGQKCP